MLSGLSALSTTFSLVIFQLLCLLPLQDQNGFERTAKIFDAAYPNKVVEVLEIRNINSKHFPLDLEIEIKNISDKPIYGLTLDLLFRQSKDDHRTPHGLTIFYGRRELFQIRNMATSADVPIRPKETIVLKAQTKMAEAFYTAIQKGSMPLEKTTLMTLVFQTINFGDGTGALFKDTLVKPEK